MTSVLERNRRGFGQAFRFGFAGAPAIERAEKKAAQVRHPRDAAARRGARQR